MAEWQSCRPNIHRGDIWYIHSKPTSVGSEQSGGRPAIVVSNNSANKHSPVLEVVFLTTQEKTKLPTHAEINSAKFPSVALCEQVTSVAIERFGNYQAHCTDEEMGAVESCLLVSLGINANSDVETKTQLAMYKKLYEDIVNKLVEKKRTWKIFK